MKLDLIFKRLILANIVLVIFFLISPFMNIESQMVLNFNYNVELNDGVFFLTIIWIVAFFISLYLLYNFKKCGKQLFLIVFIMGMVFTLLGGPIAFDPITYILDGLGMAINGALLLILYYTPISKKFRN